MSDADPDAPPTSSAGNTLPSEREPAPPAAEPLEEYYETADGSSVYDPYGARLAAPAAQTGPAASETSPGVYDPYGAATEDAGGAVS